MTLLMWSGPRIAVVSHHRKRQLDCAAERYGHDPALELNTHHHAKSGRRMARTEHDADAFEFRRSRHHYIKNFPSRMTCWPSNQMSKSRPTQSMCVLEAQFAPVCSA